MSETLYLVDGSGYIFRAYYAIRPLTNSKGLPTNAIYGFTTMLLKLIRERQPNHIAVAFDVARKTFRNDMYEDYKANRMAPPEDLVPQFPYFREVVKALNIPCLEMENYEADDVIATIARGLSKKNLKTVVVTGDKDLMQLVDKDISLFDSMKWREISFEQVEERFGVEPTRVPDILGLAGDTSDNIPGVPGVGEKTALKLLKQYGTMEDVLAHADEVKGKLGEKLRAHVEQARLCKELATVKDDVPLKYDFDQFQLEEPDAGLVQKLFEELEFHSLLKELGGGHKKLEKNYHLITEMKELNSLVNKLKKSEGYALDTETTSLYPTQADLVGLSFCCQEGEAYYVPVAHTTLEAQGQIKREDALEVLRPLLEAESPPQYGQNIKYDQIVLAHHGIHLGAVSFDTMVAAYCVNPSGSHGMDALSMEYLQYQPISFKEVVGTGKKQILFSEVPLDEACDYAAEDADITFRLQQLLCKRLKVVEQEKLFSTLEMPLVPVLMRMEQVGIKLDVTMLASLSVEYDKKLKAIIQCIYEEAGEEFNINSTKQLGKILFDKLELPIVRKTKTGYSTDTEVLQTLAEDYEIANYLLEYRALSKLKSTYVDALPKLLHPETKRIHSSFNQTVAATGRLSSSDPNLQNIPIRSEEGRRIREAFVAEDGCVLLGADYSQIELRILAHIAGDPALLEAFETDKDIHAATAAGLFAVKPAQVSSEQRSVGKTVNFGVIYGQSAFGLSKQLGIPVSEAKSYIDNFYKAYEGVQTYREQVLEKAAEQGYVETLLGRRRYFPDIKTANKMVRANMERMAFNTVFQGTAADIIKRAMITVDQQLSEQKLASKMILQVHDELIFEVPKEELKTMQALVIEKMTGAADLKVPLKVDVGSGPTWAKAKA